MIEIQYRVSLYFEAPRTKAGWTERFEDGFDCYCEE
jgi:hypothetical protein